MQSAQSWAGWDLSKSYNQRHIYEAEPEPPPSYDEDAPYYNWEDVASTNPELLCSRCMLAVLKIYSNKAGTSAFGLFLPPAEMCILCKLLQEIQKASGMEHERRVMALMNLKIPFSSLSRAPPAHMKDLVALWDDQQVVGAEVGARAVTQKIDVGGIRAISRTQVNPSVVRSWLSDCEEKHGETCGEAATQSFQPTRHIYLIDVRHFCLVRKPVPCRYVALSYVWGKAQTFRLKEKDIAPLSGLEGLRDIEDRLPQIIMDAIEFVLSIGENYLWVDAICIPQDNANELEEQISHMASLYRSALCTLVAVSSKDASESLPGVRPGTRNLRSFFETPEITLAERLTSIVPVLLSSVYHTRAWTFQERLLSARCVYFTPEQVFMQCQAGIYREDRVECTMFEKLGRDPLVLKPLSPNFVEVSSPSELSGLSKNFMLYRQIIEEYTTKSLSFEADILHAFTGVSEELGPLIQTPMVIGMPEKFFVRAMLFQPKRLNFSKRTMEMKHLDTNTKELLSLSFPSWSWCGWIGPVEYKNVGSVISCLSRVEICTASKSPRGPAVFRSFAEALEPQSPSYDTEASLYPKLAAEIQLFTIRFMASTDTTGNFKLESSTRGKNYLSVQTKAGLTCGLVRIDDPYVGMQQEKTKPMRKDTRSVGLILVCDIEQDLIRQPEEADKSQQRGSWGPKLYYDGSPWKLCAVLYVRWRSGLAERLGIGEVTKADWRRASPLVQGVHLS